MRARWLSIPNLRVSVQTLSLLLLALVPTGAVAEGSQWEWEGVSRVIALGDVHGSYDKMVTLLEGTKLVDEQLAWKGGDQHLVFCGDLTDRGSNDRYVLDLARRLQAEAEAAGGRVHVVLGNHDVMNLTRDRRYWNADLTEEFAADENEEERREALKRFRSGASSQTPHDKGAFDEQFPPGYFARARAFELDGEYGSWLIQQPTVVKVNGVLFLHGGLTESVAALGLDEINRQVIDNIRTFLSLADELGSEVPFPGDLGMIMRTAQELGDRGGRGAKGETAEALLEAHEGLAFAPAGPVWDRRTSVENERLLSDRVEAVLASLDARAIMMGHTVTRSGKISTRFDGRVYRADVGMGYGRPPLAAVIQGEKLLVFNPAQGTLEMAYVEPPQGEGWPAGEEDLSDQQLERFLQKASVKSMEPFEIAPDLTVLILELERKDMTLRAVFGDAQESVEQAEADGRTTRRRYQNQVAAYRLDRQFGLNMVPVTVFRKVDGRNGVVQIWIQSAWDLDQILEYGLTAAQLSDMETEIAKARAFSSLIGMEDPRDREHIGAMIVPASRKVMLGDNGKSFTESPGLGAFLEDGCGLVGDSFLHALSTLELGKLNKDLGDLLSKRQIEAILARRDGILEECAKPDPDWSIQRLLDEARERAKTQD